MILQNTSLGLNFINHIEKLYPRTGTSFLPFLIFYGYGVPPNKPNKWEVSSTITLPKNIHPYNYRFVYFKKYKLINKHYRLHTSDMRNSCLLLLVLLLYSIKYGTQLFRITFPFMVFHQNLLIKYDLSIWSGHNCLC